MNKLNHHLRQYRHNNSDGFVAGYEQEGTEAFVSCLEQEIAELKKRVNDLDELRKGSMNCVKQQREEIAQQQQEIESLKLRLELADEIINKRFDNEKKLREQSNG